MIYFFNHFFVIVYIFFSKYTPTSLLTCLLPCFLAYLLTYFSNFYYVTNIFDLHIFDNKTAALLFFFEICTDMHFVSLFFLNERKITTSLLMIHLKCTNVHYANLNPSSEKKPFLNYRSLNMLFHFFRFLIYVY